MTSFRFLAGAALSALCAAAAAQNVPLPAASPTGDADRLAADMRLVASDPRNVTALVDAGDLSLRLGDVSGAASLFARADRIDPRNGRVKAGMASVLLRNERPGEALVYFGQAEGYGLPVASFAADRGLAYDLIGQQGRAQHDYRVALAVHADDEVVRRYALSLAISGQREAALLQLDPLVRREDRGAWRTRAFVMAMGGDAAAATDIARRMMAPGQAEGLAPFFQRLPTLSAVDRAFAVQFGEVRPTAQRIADARMAPALPPMAPEVVAVPVARPAPVRVATVSTPAPKRRGRREVQVAAAAPAIVTPNPVAPALPAPPAYSAPAPLAYAGPAPARPTPPYRLARPGTGTDPVSAANAAMLAAATGARAQPARVASAYPLTPLPSAVASTPPVAVAAVARPAVVSAPRTGPAAGADVSAFSEQFRVARVRDAAAAAANRSALVTAPASIATSRMAQAAPEPVPLVAAPATPAASTAAPAAPAKAVATETAPALPLSTTGEADAVLARLLSRIILPGDDLARAAQVAAAPIESPARDMPAATGAPSAVPARVQEPGRVAASPVAPAEAPPLPIAPGHATRNASIAAARTPEAASRPSARSTNSDAVGSAERGADGAGRGRHGQTTASEPAETDRVSAKIRDRHGRTDIADATVTPRSRHGATLPDTVAAEDDIRSRRASRGDADTSVRPGKRGKQSAETDAPATTAAQKRASDRKAAADKKVADAKKLADAQKAEDAKEAAEAKKVAKAEPQRYWVQVSGGANEADLPKAWVKAQGQAAALKGRSGYTTPLRATNRVLAGPFKTDAEAKTFMDKVRAQGIPAWQFTSTPGQKVSKLP